MVMTRLIINVRTTENLSHCKVPFLLYQEFRHFFESAFCAIIYMQRGTTQEQMTSGIVPNRVYRMNARMNR